MTDPSAAIFNYAAWAARYPELAGSVLEPLATLYWDEAGLYLLNTGASQVTDIARRGVLLNMLTAHIAALNATINGQAPSGLVGRVASATEGSVSVSTAASMLPGSAEWYAQTRYGLSFWTATARYRMARYYAGNVPYLGVGGPRGTGYLQ